MVSRMHPENVELLDYVEGDLDDTARAQIEAHVAGCAECAEQIRFLEAGRDAVRGAPLLEAPERAMPSVPAREPVRQWGLRLRTAVTVLAPVAVIALVVGVLATTDPNGGNGAGDEAGGQAALTAAQESAGDEAPAAEAGVTVESVAGPPEDVVRLLQDEGLDARREGRTVVVSGATVEQVERALADRSPGAVRVVIGE
jgi:anti-sigma factor RsiW